MENCQIFKIDATTDTADLSKSFVFENILSFIYLQKGSKVYKNLKCLIIIYLSLD